MRPSVSAGLPRGFAGLPHGLPRSGTSCGLICLLPVRSAARCDSRRTPPPRRPFFRLRGIPHGHSSFISKFSRLNIYAERPLPVGAEKPGTYLRQGTYKKSHQQGPLPAGRTHPAPVPWPRERGGMKNPYFGCLSAPPLFLDSGAALCGWPYYSTDSPAMTRAICAFFPAIQEIAPSPLRGER